MVGYFLSGKGGVRSVSEEMAIRLEARGYRILTTSSEPNRYLRLVDMISSIVHHRHDFRLATVEVYYGWAFLWAEMACWTLRLLKKPFILTLHGGYLPDFARSWPVRVRNLLTSAQIVTTPSTLFKETFSRWRADILYVPNAIEVAHYPFRPRVRVKPDLIWLRAFERPYHPHLAVRAFALIAKVFPQATLTMIGPDKKDGTLQEVVALASSLGVTARLKVVGAVPKPEVPTWLAGGDVFLNTPRYESFGVTVMEAAATGMCIVTTRVGELPRLWSEGEEALLTSPDNPEEMAYAIKRILMEPELAARLSHKARRKAELFDWSLILPQWEMLLNSI
jgi:glycosyltransferase involved in cell wall biosynthesis